MDFNLNVNVQIGVTPQLATLLTALLQSRPATPVQLPATEAPAPEPAESEKPRRTRRAKTETAETAAPVEAVAEAPEADAPAAEPIPFAEAPVQQPEKELTEEDIRAAMHRTRQRFEGEDYKENTDSENYTKYHKQLTGMFKQIAAVLGADKPSALPAEMRASFIAECDALIIDEKGFIAPPPAPY